MRGLKLWQQLRRAPRPLRALMSRVLLSLSPSTTDRFFSAVASLLPDTLRQRRPGELLQKLARVLPSSDRVTLYARLATVCNGFHDRRAVANELAYLSKLVSHGNLTDRDWLMAADTLLYLPDDILTKVDRASMGVSLEIRCPLLDHNLFESAWRLPSSLKFRYGTGKWCLRQILAGYLPQNLINRPKSGFAIPIGKWLRGPLREWAESLMDKKVLTDTGIEVLMSREEAGGIRALWTDHLSGRDDHSPILWTALMYQAWHQRWMR